MTAGKPWGSIDFLSRSRASGDWGTSVLISTRLMWAVKMTLHRTLGFIIFIMSWFILSWAIPVSRPCSSIIDPMWPFRSCAQILAISASVLIVSKSRTVSSSQSVMPPYFLPLSVQLPRSFTTSVQAREEVGPRVSQETPFTIVVVSSIETSIGL